jgi:hypothetical protein
MACRIAFLREAEDCIKEQLQWYTEDESHGGTELAEKWLDALQQSLKDLETRPTRFGYAAENGKWHPQIELRQMPFEPWKRKHGWRVLFSIDEEAKVVTILQIRHEHRPFLHVD